MILFSKKIWNNLKKFTKKRSLRKYEKLMQENLVENFSSPGSRRR